MRTSFYEDSSKFFVRLAIFIICPAFISLVFALLIWLISAYSIVQIGQNNFLVIYGTLLTASWLLSMFLLIGFHLHKIKP